MACFISVFVHLPMWSPSIGPVGLTMMKLSRKASSIGPCRPCRLRSRRVSVDSVSFHRPSTFSKCVVHERSESGLGASSRSPSITTLGFLVRAS